MDTEITKIKMMKLDKLKSRIEEFNNDILNLSIVDTSISEFNKKIDDSRHILNDLENMNQKLTSELISKELHYKEQQIQYREYEKDNELIKKKIAEVESNSALQRLQNLSYVDMIEKEQVHLQEVEAKYNELEQQRNQYNNTVYGRCISRAFRIKNVELIIFLIYLSQTL